MKMRLIPILVVSALVGVVCLVAGQQQKGKPAVQGNRCTVFPGTALPEPNLSNIVKRLRRDKYPDNFRVRVWSNGKPTQTIGSMRISESEMSQTDKYAKSIELTGLTGRIGECLKVMAGSAPRGGVNAAAAPGGGVKAAPSPEVDNLKNLIDDISKDLR